MQEGLTRVLNKCLAINKQGNYHAFFDFAGHVNGITVRLTESDIDYICGYHYDFSYYKYCNASDIKSVLSDLDNFLD